MGSRIWRIYYICSLTTGGNYYDVRETNKASKGESSGGEIIIKISPGSRIFKATKRYLQVTSDGWIYQTDDFADWTLCKEIPQKPAMSEDGILGGIRSSNFMVKCSNCNTPISVAYWRGFQGMYCFACGEIIANPNFKEE